MYIYIWILIHGVVGSGTDYRYIGIMNLAINWIYKAIATAVWIILFCKASTNR